MAHPKRVTPPAFEKMYPSTGMGMELEDKKDMGVIVISILPGGAAAKDGRIMIGDIVRKVDGVQVKSPGDAKLLLMIGNVGTYVELTIFRPSTMETTAFNIRRPNFRPDRMVEEKLQKLREWSRIFTKINTIIEAEEDGKKLELGEQLAKIQAMVEAAEERRVEEEKSEHKRAQAEDKEARRRALEAKELKVQRMLRIGLVMAFERWREKKELKMKEGKAVMRLMKSGLMMTLQRWREHVEGERELRMKEGNAVMRLMKAGVVMAFERWLKHAEEERKLRKRAGRAVIRLLKAVQRRMDGTLVSSLDRWRDHITEDKQMKRKAGKVLQRLMKAVFVSAFGGWRDHMIEEAQKKRRVLKAAQVVMRLKKSVLVMGMKLWRDARGLKCKALKSAQRFRNALLVSVLETWLERVKAERELERVEAEGLEHLSLQRCQIKKTQDLKVIVVHLMSTCLVADVFASWLQKLKDEDLLRRKTRKVVMRFRKLGIVMAFERWREQTGVVTAEKKWAEEKSVAEKAQTDAKARVLEAKEMKMVQHAIKIRLVMALERWCALIETERGEREKSQVQEYRLQIADLEGQVSLMKGDTVLREEQLKRLQVSLDEAVKSAAVSDSSVTWLHREAANAHAKWDEHFSNLNRLLEDEQRRGILVKDQLRQKAATCNEIEQQLAKEMEQRRLLTFELQLLQAQMLSGRERNDWLASELERAHAAITSIHHFVLDAGAQHAAVLASISRPAIDAQSTRAEIIEMSESECGGVGLILADLDRNVYEMGGGSRSGAGGADADNCRQEARDEASDIRESSNSIRSSQNTKSPHHISDAPIANTHEVERGGRRETQRVRDREAARGGAGGREGGREAHTEKPGRNNGAAAKSKSKCVANEAAGCKSPTCGGVQHDVQIDLIPHSHEADDGEERATPDRQNGRGGDGLNSYNFVRIADIFVGAAASRCVPVLNVGDYVLRVNAVDVKGMSGRQVRRLIDGNNGTTVTLTNWSRQRGVTYSVTLTRAHLPCVTSSGNGADMYATDLIARMHDMMEDMRLLATALCDEKRASEQQRFKAHAKHEELKVLKVLTHYLLASVEDAAAVAHSIHASIANDLEVQTQTLLACKREVCERRDHNDALGVQARETRDHNTFLQDQLGAMHGHIQKESTYNQQLRSRVHDLEQRLQHALMHSQRLALQIKSSVRNRSHLMWQRRLQRILAVWRRLTDLARYSALKTLYEVVLDRLGDQTHQSCPLSQGTKFNPTVTRSARNLARNLVPRSNCTRGTESTEMNHSEFLQRAESPIEQQANSLDDSDDDATITGTVRKGAEGNREHTEVPTRPLAITPNSTRARLPVPLLPSTRDWQRHLTREYPKGLNGQMPTAQLAQIFQTIVQSRDEGNYSSCAHTRDAISSTCRVRLSE